MENKKKINKQNGNLNIVGKTIGKIRKEKKMSRQELSNKLVTFGIRLSAQSIYGMEKGTRSIYDYELCAIAKVLDTTVDEVMKDVI